MEVTPGYSIGEIPYSGSPFAWVDNDEVLFAGTRNSSGASVQEAHRIALYRWNVRTGQVTELDHAGGAPEVCYDRGYLHVAFNNAEDRVLSYGPIGQQTRIAFNRKTAPPFAGIFNRYDCRFHERPQSTNPNAQVVEVLRNDHGFIEVERQREGFPPRKYFLVTPTGKRVQLANFHGGAGAPRLSLHKEAYVYQYGGGDLSEKAEKQISLISVEGQVIDLVLPKGPWLSGATRAMPVRDGILIISPAILSGADGAYLARGDHVERMVKGYVNDFSVSPNGCSVVIYVKPNERSNARHVALNTCQGR